LHSLESERSLLVSHWPRDMGLETCDADVSLPLSDEKLSGERPPEAHDMRSVEERPSDGLERCASPASIPASFEDAVLMQEVAPIVPGIAQDVQEQVTAQAPRKPGKLKNRTVAAPVNRSAAEGQPRGDEGYSEDDAGKRVNGQVALLSSGALGTQSRMQDIGLESFEAGAPLTADQLAAARSTASAFDGPCDSSAAGMRAAGGYFEDGAVGALPRTSSSDTSAEHGRFLEREAIASGLGANLLPGIAEAPLTLTAEESALLRDGFPSIGSANHFINIDDCRRCCFFNKGRCANGFQCSYCHYDHDAKANPKKKRGKGENESGGAQDEEVDSMGNLVQWHGEEGDWSAANTCMAWQAANNGSSLSEDAFHRDPAVSVIEHPVPVVARPPRLPCYSSTCTFGPLPKCPLCGRTRDGAR